MNNEEWDTKGKQLPLLSVYMFPGANSARAQIGTKLKCNHFEPEILSGVIFLFLAGTV